MTDELQYEVVRDVLPSARVLLQRNPGPMTLDGTNTWLLAAPGAGSSVVVDPGQDDPAHLQGILDAAGTVELILLTHKHHDHSDLVPALHDATRAPVRAIDPSWCRGADPLQDGDRLHAGGLTIDVLATPGHTADSASFVLDGTAVLTGDTILGRGTTVVAHPDGVLADYLASLNRLRDLGDAAVLPGHGPELERAGAAAEFYLAHREQRLAQVRDALERLGPGGSARQIVEDVYADVDENVWWAAELSVRAQLDYLARP